MKEIKLTQGKVALVDDEDYEWLSQWKWCWLKDRGGRAGYAFRRTKNKEKDQQKSSVVMMSRFIMDAPKGLFVDHISHNSLDNQKINLRLVTNQQNSFNSRSRQNTASLYKGITPGGKERWKATIRVNDKVLYLGRYTSQIEAAKVYDAAARKYYGEFAFLNFPIATQ